jgi:hypothetical protein
LGSQRQFNGDSDDHSKTRLNNGAFPDPWTVQAVYGGDVGVVMALGCKTDVTRRETGATWRGIIDGVNVLEDRRIALAK